MEARVYAEDPLRNFLPSTGRLARYRPPAESKTVRVDTGVYEGGEISMYYDPMIAKLIAMGKDRHEAAAHLADALDEFYVRGVSHNISFLAAIATHKRFLSGKLSTGFIAEEFPDGFTGAEWSPETRAVLLATAAIVQRRLAETEAGVDGQLAGHEMKLPDRFVVRFNGNGGEDHPVRVVPAERGYIIAVEGKSGLDGATIRTDWRPGDPLFRAVIAERHVAVQVEYDGVGWRLFHRGVLARALVLRARLAELAALMPVKKPPDTSKFLLSPMPGLLKSLAVAEGHEVKAGEELAVIEAMKMENVLRAPRDGKVVKHHAAAGDSLAVDQKILEFG
jgi:propionyl-CoA carboxylase alpha chain